MTLRTDPNLARPDDLYELLIGLHAGLDEAASLRASAALVLLLANHVGDPAVIAQAVKRARDAAMVPVAP